ncbi:twin transmembrane helix small protein [Maricaulis sp. D1M11]|uniref:twin transmembrane helix small protein n=1 Tax=Maricaulis sp. D1M11 TaxID=3076117 RepID=UPI0039B4E46C
MADFLSILIYLAIGGTAVVLVLGIISLYRSGDKARSQSNKLMRARVALQALAIALLGLLAFVKANFGS